jgi:hypothetical protein
MNRKENLIIFKEQRKFSVIDISSLVSSTARVASVESKLVSMVLEAKQPTNPNVGGAWHQAISTTMFTQTPPRILSPRAYTRDVGMDFSV